MRKGIIYIFSLFIVLFLSLNSTFGAYEPSKTVSGLQSCSYMVYGYKYNGTVFTKPWTNVDCKGGVNLNTIGLVDGEYEITLKSVDRTGNVMQNQVFNYKYDSTPVNCTLDEINFYDFKNQYYNNGNFYFKGNAGFLGGGKFDLTVTCKDNLVENAKCGADATLCVSGIKEINFPTILGDSQTKVSYGDDTEIVTLTKTYSWNGDNYDSFDILNNTGNFALDNAGNISELKADSNTVVKLDGEVIETPISNLRLIRDVLSPVINENPQIRLGNNNDGSFIDLGLNSNTRYFSAENRDFKPYVSVDDLSGIQETNISIEDPEYLNSYLYYTYDGNNIINHPFTDVNKIGDVNNYGYRKYSWEFENEYGTDKICDNVGNCLDNVPTPDFRVVSNQYSSSKSISNLSDNFEGKVSDLTDYYNLNIHIKDKFGNEITPVDGLKEIRINADFTNTMGLNQVNSEEYKKGDGVLINFVDGDNSLININKNSTNTNFSGSIYKYNNLDNSNLNIKVYSVVPTRDKYITSSTNPGGTNELIYGNNDKANLQLNSLTFEVISSQNSVGEMGNIDFAALNKPYLSFDPVVNFNYIDNIFPLVEGQVKSMTLKKIINNRNGNLDNYDLEIKTGTNNNFVEITKAGLQFGNENYAESNSQGVNIYNVVSQDLGYTDGFGYMYLNTMYDKYQILPQTLGGIEDENVNIGLFSYLKYKINSKEVKLPSIQTGMNGFGAYEELDFSNSLKYNNDSSLIFSEINIAGITQTANKFGEDDGEGAVTTGNDTYQDFSNISILDIKSNIERNVSNLTKTIDKNSAKVNGGYNLNSLDYNSVNKGLKLGNGNILYFYDTDVIIDCGNSCSILGNKTIIVEKGSLQINSNLYYENSDSIFGIILLGNDVSGNYSKLKISEEITNGVGVVYSDGPIMSSTTSGEVYNGSNIGENLVNQLYWKGSFISRNTVGASILMDENNKPCPYGTPEYESSLCTQEVAQGYDLIYLRRYARVDNTYYDSTSEPMGDSKVPLHSNSGAIKISGNRVVRLNSMSSGDSNLIKSDNFDSPLILEYDTSLQDNPPVGFEK